MRQIEDRWRVNIRDPPNNSEMYLNLLNNFTINQSQSRDIKSYAQHMLKSYVSNKCSDACLKVPNVDYKNCIQNCSQKLIDSRNIFLEQVNEFEDKFTKLGDKVFFN